MGEASSDNMPRQEIDQKPPHTIDTYRPPGYREPHRKGDSIMPVRQFSEPLRAQTKMTRRQFLGRAAPVAAAGAALAVDAATQGGVRNIIGRLFSGIREQNARYSEPQPTESSNLPSVESFPPPIDREIVKIHRGNIEIQTSGELKIRRDAMIPDPWADSNDPKVKTPNDVKWTDIKLINGAELAERFLVTDAPLVEGQAVDNAGLGRDWIKFAAELKNGERTILYISKSENTRQYVQPKGRDEAPKRNPSGKINEPNMGKITTMPAPR